MAESVLGLEVGAPQNTVTLPCGDLTLVVVSACVAIAKMKSETRQTQILVRSHRPKYTY